MKNIFLTILTALLLYGCCTPQPAQERIVYKVIQVPAEMTEKVTLTPPPEPVLYSTLKWDKQEELLMLLLQDRTQEVGTCNTRLNAIDVWSTKQLRIYEPVNP